MSQLAYQTRDIEQYTDSLARYLPNDTMFLGKWDAENPIRKFLKGLAFTLFDVNGKLKEFTDDYLPDETQNFLVEWEKAVGIPDACFTNTETASRRRLQIIAKLSYMACQTAQDFIDLAELFGFIVTITPGIEDVSGATSGLTDTEKRFTMVINTFLEDEEVFPYEFPFIFPEGEANFLECIFETVKIGNGQILFNNQG